ncbi:outer membrane protein transport protein [Vibrio diabolicus]|jgi:long-chain fatty acid transport protein|uniref:Outer membrane protein transport protein n=1 Tax=Vibrio diabolicus TaxID=50719 RepID=A0AA92LTB8_9VIBR|nr:MULTISPECIES: outer membrane protein transport protein [Vibrio diabolicus subgroup]MCR9567846.1 outer membrane protein transport protein [Vibrio alginolyticus]EMD79364.1 Long-chain fatty acid transport protein [Vibrio diabolicus E0666]MCR9302396.1 outer membrane protein transport protein [Vibrio diabolicus]MCR9363840.1 outer membrane protein transport protein [Vibrio antiquarius]MCR9426245.1 outer membrane protein transport protein [Vibrio diabolicus]
MKTNKTLLSTAVALSLLGTTGMANAAGFQLAEYSATGLGRAYAGEAAMADNASAQWRNPAMLTYLEGTQVSVGAIYVNPNIDIEGDVNFHGSTSSASSDDFAHDAIIPNFYLSHQYNEKFAIGLAFGTNYGMETDLGKGFGASHFGNEASVTTMEANLNAAYKVNESISVGGGIRYIIGEGSFGAAAPKNNVVGQHPVTGDPISVPQGTALKYMEGDDTAWGWQVGTAWQINENNRIGFAYKSEVELKLEGHAEGLGFGFGTKLSQLRDNGYMYLNLPATAELASFHQVTDQLALHASFNWTDWSSFEKLEARLDTAGTHMVKVENWEDNYRFAVGATYQLDPKLALRTGIAYDTSAVSDKNRTITIPETDRTWLSIGATYDWTKDFSLDAGFTYIFAKDAPIVESRGYKSDDAAEQVGGQFVGETTGNVWLIGVQANYRF